MKKKKEDKVAQLDNLEERKLKEIEHSKRRREILQGFERHIDVDRTGDPTKVESMIRDEKSFEYHLICLQKQPISPAQESKHVLRHGASVFVLD